MGRLFDKDVCKKTSRPEVEHYMTSILYNIIQFRLQSGTEQDLVTTVKLCNILASDITSEGIIQDGLSQD